MKETNKKTTNKIRLIAPMATKRYVPSVAASSGGRTLTLTRWFMGFPIPVFSIKKGKGSLYSITERRVPKLIPVLGSQPAGDVSHKPGGRLPLLSVRSAVTHCNL